MISYPLSTAVKYWITTDLLKKKFYWNFSHYVDLMIGALVLFLFYANYYEFPYNIEFEGKDHIECAV